MTVRTIPETTSLIEDDSLASATVLIQRHSNRLGSVLDRQIQEAAQQALNTAGYNVLSRVEVHVAQGHVHLTGRVPSYYLKSVATAEILKLDNVRRLTNELQVVERKERQT